jgi:hypothetical protein
MIFLLATSLVSAQVASHTPTVFKPTQTAKPAAADPGSDRPVARVNGVVLTAGDLLREEYTIFPYGRQHNGIPKDLEPEIRAGALKMIVFEELVYQEALRRKMTVPAATMQSAEAEFRKQFSPDQYQAALQTEFHGSVQELRGKIRRSLLIDEMMKAEIEAKSKVTPAEVRAYYDSTPKRFEHPETFTFQSISVLPPAKATPSQSQEGQKRAQDALRQAKTTKTSEQFGLLAEKISDDDYRVMMGQHKPLPVEQIAPQVLKALRGMKPGDVSDVIQFEQAYTIVRLGAHTPAGETPFEEVKAQLEKELPQSRQNELRSQLDKKLRQNAKVEEL